jgi:hypothetical protein
MLAFDSSIFFFEKTTQNKIMKTKILFFAISLLVFSCTQEKGLQPQNYVQILKA